MSLLFNILMTLVLITGILIVLVGSLWVLCLQLNELLEVDVLWKVKRKARSIIYADRETMGRMLGPGTSRGHRNRIQADKVKRSILQRRNLWKKIQIQSDDADEEGGRDREKI